MPLIRAQHYSVWIRVEGAQTRIDTNPDAMTRAEVIALLQAVERELASQEEEHEPAADAEQPGPDG